MTMKIDSPENLSSYLDEMSQKRHFSLPETLTIQLQKPDGSNLNLENILCHLNIQVLSPGYYTYSFIPTDSSGKIILKKEQLIQQTQIKHDYDPTLPLDESIVKFDFFLMDKQMLSLLINQIERYLSVGKESIVNELKKRGFDDDSIQIHLQSIELKRKEDTNLLLLLKSNNNQLLHFSGDKSRVSGTFKNNDCQFYKITVEEE